MTKEEAIIYLNKLYGMANLTDEYGDMTDTEPYEEALDMAISALSENKGEWSRHTRVEPVYSIDGVKTWGDKCQCNRCTFTTIAVEGFGYYNFCPNCGADMRGET